MTTGVPRGRRSAVVVVVAFLAILAFGQPMPPAPVYSDCDTLVSSNGGSPSLTTSLINQLIVAHNDYRRNVTPTATTMPMLIWSDVLAAGAQQYINTCPGITHSTQQYRMNKSWTGFDYVGENLAAGMRFQNGDGFKYAVKMWGDERDGFTFVQTCSRTASCGNCTGFPSCGHYKQMVWAKSLQFGCAYKKCAAGTSAYEENYGCWYGPGGNINGQAPYVAGPSTNTPCGTAATSRGPPASTPQTGSPTPTGGASATSKVPPTPTTTTPPGQTVVTPPPSGPQATTLSANPLPSATSASSAVPTTGADSNAAAVDAGAAAVSGATIGGAVAGAIAAVALAAVVSVLIVLRLRQPTTKHATFNTDTQQMSQADLSYIAMN